MINFSVSRPPRALIFSAKRKKKTSTVSMEGFVETASRPPFKAAVVVAGPVAVVSFSH